MATEPLQARRRLKWPGRRCSEARNGGGDVSIGFCLSSGRTLLV